MTEPIVVGVALRDDDHAPLALAVDLARFTGAPLALVHVHPRGPLPPLPSMAHGGPLHDRAMDALRQVAEPLRADCELTLHAEASNSPVRGLHVAALALDGALLVVGSSHRGPLDRVLPGGVGERLLHSAPCAVAVAPRGYTGAADGIRRLGVAFIDAPDGREALDVAATMAALGDASLSTFTVLEPPRIGPDATPGWVPTADYDARRRLRAAEERLRAYVPEGVDADTTVLEGGAVELLAGASAKLDLLVCGSRGYGPLLTVLLGAVSGRLAHTAMCPLIVLPRERSGVIQSQ